MSRAAKFGSRTPTFNYVSRATKFDRSHSRLSCVVKSFFCRCFYCFQDGDGDSALFQDRFQTGLSLHLMASVK